MNESTPPLSPPPQTLPPLPPGDPKKPDDHASGPARMSFIRRFILALVLMLFAGLLYAGVDAWLFLSRPADRQNPKDIVIDIQPGAGFDMVAWDLRRAGAVKSVWRFRLLAKLQGKLGSIQAGEFQVNSGWTPNRMLNHLVSGRPVLYRLSLREGLTWWQVAQLVEEGGFAGAAEFAAVIHDPEFLRNYGIPFSNAEGFLYPETYLLRKPRSLGGRAQAEAVAKVLVETHWKRTWPLWQAYAAANTEARFTPVTIPAFSTRNGTLVPRKPLPVADDSVMRAPVNNATTPAAASNNSTGDSLPVAGNEQRLTPAASLGISEASLRRSIILASLVERETGIPSERARVAGVYANRLRLGMLLQCDPTIIYGLGESFSGPIRRSHLDSAENPYNTYRHPGLPPGPICSPGSEAIKAALAPEEHSYLYFVATGEDGSHRFSVTLAEHNRAVEKYREAVRRQRQ